MIANESDYVQILPPRAIGEYVRFLRKLPCIYTSWNCREPATQLLSIHLLTRARLNGFYARHFVGSLYRARAYLKSASKRARARVEMRRSARAKVYIYIAGVSSPLMRINSSIHSARMN